ncbi:collagen binding domain-containing protein [Streptomyces sp. NPDC059011]|uniref:MSCRAMM family protein n=1 Tax=unclassified Streptomyces TaxID=2593676 RepID=UPI0036CC53CE
MRIRPVRRLPAAVTLAAAVTGTLTWAPTASAQMPEPTPSTSTAPTETPETAAGSVAIIKKDQAGDLMQGAAFLLLDATGQEAGTGKTDAQGKLTFTDLAPGIYRLKETSSGSSLHNGVPVRMLSPAANGGDQSSDLVGWGSSGVLVASASARRPPFSSGT